MRRNRLSIHLPYLPVFSAGSNGAVHLLFGRLPFCSLGRLSWPPIFRTVSHFGILHSSSSLFTCSLLLLTTSIPPPLYFTQPSPQSQRLVVPFVNANSDCLSTVRLRRSPSSDHVLSRRHGRTRSQRTSRVQRSTNPSRLGS